MTDLGPGTPMICVDAVFERVVGYLMDPPLTEGALYFVAKVLVEGANPLCPRDGCGHTFLEINARPNTGYCPNRFRPLNDGSTDLVDDAEPVAPRVAEPVA
jgi:hypothetical protein